MNIKKDGKFIGVDLYVGYKLMKQFLLLGVGISCVTQATVMFVTNRMLQWWTLDSVSLPLVNKPKVEKEALQWSGERKCKVKSIKPNSQAN